MRLIISYRRNPRNHADNRRRDPSLDIESISRPHRVEPTSTWLPVAHGHRLAKDSRGQTPTGRGDPSADG